LPLIIFWLLLFLLIHTIAFIMNSLLQLLLSGERLDSAQMAQVLNQSEAQVEAELARLESEGALLGWRAILNPEKVQDGLVRAVIEVRLSPEHDGGFDRIAERISQFDAVESCYLMSGSYDLLIFAKGEDLRTVASFVSERLASVEGVLSTATHFRLRSYKEQGHLLSDSLSNGDKPPVSA
jgi:DNA-binding Lrp family transcriptional regulator